MHKLDTDELEKILESTHPENIGNYVHMNDEEIIHGDRPFSTYVKERIKEKHPRLNEILLQADIPLNYGYKLLNMEKRTTKRDIILRICYAAQFTLEETQHTLRLYSMPTLYARDARDALIISCLHNRPGNIISVNEYLVKNKHMPLKTCGEID